MASKNKTNKSVSKRIKRTANGKLKHAQCGKRHLNAHITAKKRRQLRGTEVTTGPLVKKYLIAIGEYAKPAQRLHSFLHRTNASRQILVVGIRNAQEIDTAGAQRRDS